MFVRHTFRVQAGRKQTARQAVRLFSKQAGEDMLLRIKHKLTGDILLEVRVETREKVVRSDVNQDSPVSTGMELTGMDLSHAQLRNAALQKANLSYTDLTGANLRGAELEQANLTTAELTLADLREANLTGANLFG